MSIQKLPNGRWRVQIRRKNLHFDQVFDSEPEARAAQKKFVDAQKGQPGITLEDAWPIYEKSLEFTKKKARTQDTEASRIKRILRRFGKRAVASITSEDVEQYIVSRMKEESKPSSDAIRLETAAMSALMKFCRRKGWIAANPCIGVARPPGKIAPKRMSAEQEGALIELQRHSNIRFRSAARLCLLVRETGARPGEWQNATYDDVDLDNEKVVFRNTKYRNEPRTVPLTKAAVRLLAEHLEDVMITNVELFGGANLLFPAVGRDGEIRPMHYTGALRDAKKHSLLPKSVRAHTGRHEFISTLLEETDLDDARVMALVGHHSPSSMEAYKHVRNVRFRPHIEGVEPARRTRRVSSLAKSIGIPTKLLQSFLEKIRQQQLQQGDKDEGEELLYTKAVLDELHSVVDRLGLSPAERRPALAKIIGAITSQRSADRRGRGEQDMAPADDSSDNAVTELDEE